MKRFLPMLLALCCVLTGCQKAADPVAATEAPTAAPTAQAEETAEPVAIVATVNGEDLLFSDYTAIESAYLYQYEVAGVDLTDPETYAYLQDLALTYAIEQMLVKQDMRAQGCYDFDAETENWFLETGKAAYAQALQDVIDAMRTAETNEDELMVYALAYAQSLNVTEQTYIDFYRNQYAAARYYEWLTRDNPVTDEDVQSAYEARVADSKALYEHDVAAFEAAMSSSSEVWYKPAGYRSVLQILLPAQGDTAEAKLQSVQSTVDEINARLERGDSFQALIAEYGADTSFTDEAFLAVGYQVHRDSVQWADEFVAAAFSAEMTQPGSVSLPFASDLGVHILYYLCDSASGPIELTAELRDALSYTIYTERYTAAQAQRINELAAAAEIVFH